MPQTILPHFFGSGIVKTAHPLLCTPQGPIRVLPDHAHEGVCEVTANLGAMYAIGTDSFREYPDGPDGRPLAPVVVVTSTMIPGAAAPEVGKPPVPGGSFGAIGAWDGHQAGRYGVAEDIAVAGGNAQPRSHARTRPGAAEPGWLGAGAPAPRRSGVHRA